MTERCLAQTKHAGTCNRPATAERGIDLHLCTIHGTLFDEWQTHFGKEAAILRIAHGRNAEQLAGYTWNHINQEATA